MQNALKSANKATSSLSRELKGINTLLKFDPKSTQLLSQKQEVLKENIKATTQQLNSLKEAQQRYIESGGDLNTSEYRNLQREILIVENNLKSLNLEASKWTEASKNLSELSVKMKSLGDTVSSVGKKVSVLSASISGLFVAGTKYNADIEKYTTAFKTFLGSAEAAEKAVSNIKAQAETSPFDTKDLIQANQMLITTGVSADDALKTISALSDAIALTGGSNDTLSRMASNLQQIKNVGKASAMDIRQFGMAGIDIYGILSDYTGKTTSEVKKMEITYEQLSNALQKAASEGGKYFGGQAEMSNTLSGQISKLKKSFQDLLGELSSGIFPIVKGLAKRIQEVVNWVKNLDDSQKQIITKIGLVIALLGPALLIIGKIITLGSSIFGTLSKISSVIARLTTGTSALNGIFTTLAGPVGIIIAIVGALTLAFIHLYKTNEEFRKKVKATWENIVNLFNTYVIPVINSLKSLVMSVINTTIELIKKLWSYMEPAFNKMFTWLMDFWNNTLSKIISNVLSFVNELLNVVKIIWDKVISPIVSFLSDILGPVFSFVFQKILAVIGGVCSTIGNIIKSVTGVFDGLITFISGVFSGNWKKAWEGIVKVFKNIVDGLWSIIKIPLNWIISGINTLIKGINKVKVPDWVPGIGGKGINVPLIPKLAKGGIVNDATLAMIGEGRAAEAVIPLDRTLTKYMAEAMKQAGGRETININFYPQKMSEAELDNAFNYINRKFGLVY